jgi:hypothetical protein
MCYYWLPGKAWPVVDTPSSVDNVDNEHADDRPDRGRRGVELGEDSAADPLPVEAAA